MERRGKEKKKRTGEISPFWGSCLLSEGHWIIRTQIFLTYYLRLCCQKAHVSLGVWSRSGNVRSGLPRGELALQQAGSAAPCPGDFDLLFVVLKL